MKKVLLSLCGLVLSVCAVYAGDLDFVFNEKFYFDDNIYLTDKNKESSLISTTRLGVDFKSNIPQTALDFNVGALLGYNYYFTDPSVNSFFDALVNAAVKNDNLNVENIFRYTEDPADSSITERIARISNFTKVYFQTARYNLLSFGIGAINNYDDYLDDKYEALSRNRISLIADVYYEIFSRADIYLDYTASYTQYASNEENDSFGNSVGVGIKGDLTPRIKANVKLSFDNRNYSKNRIISQGDANNHFGIFGYEASLKWEPINSASFVLSGHRKAEETQYYLDRYYISTLASLYAKQTIYDVISGSLLFSYEELSYSQNSYSSSYGAKRTDNILKIRPAVEIETGDGASVVVWYSYADKTSDKSYNGESFEYADNVIGADFKIKF
ncbi:MAG: outer membrane beta-barrel protein [Endomicrobium sp.]|nr:outer membrane beta-barrel protein [Endomicrobium sp.]